MTMTRADTLDYISGNFALLGPATSTPFTDSYAGFKVAIDSALVTLGYGTADTVADDDVPDYMLAVNYYALQRMAFNSGASIDYRLSLSGGERFGSQLFANVQDLVNDARNKVVIAGLTPNDITGMLRGTLNIDFLEPTS